MPTETLVIQIDAKGARLVSRDINSIEKEAQKAATQTQLLKRALGGLAVGLAIRSVVRTLADFSQAMSTVRAITGATEAEFRLLNETARDLGATTRFTATQAAEGLTFLARAGFSVNESLETIEGTLRLAQAGALDLGRAADIASNVLRGFRLNTSETGRVVDVLALAANSANTTVEQLGDALKFVGPIASGVGLSLEDTVAAVAELSNAGLQATLAGTGLRRVISELESPSAKTRKEIALLGEEVDRGEISTLGLFASLQKLSEAGVDTGRALEIFGDRGGPAFEVLSGGSKAAEELAEKLRNAEGTAERISNIMDDNLNGALLRVKSATEALVLAFGELGNQNILTGFLNATAATLRFLAENIEIVEGALIGLAVAAIPFVITQLKALTVAIASTGIGAIAVAIGAAIGALIAFSDQIKISADGMATLADVFVATFEVLTEIAQPAIEFVASLFGDVSTSADDAFGNVQLSIQTVLQVSARFADRFIGVYVGAFNAIVAAFKNLPAAFVDIFTQALNGAISIVEDGINSIVGALNVLPGVEIGAVNLGEIKSGFEGGAAELGRAVQDGFLDGFNQTFVQDTVGTILERAEQRALDREARQAPTTDVERPEFNQVDSLINADKTQEKLRTVGAGIKSGLELIKNDITDFKSFTEDALVGAFNKAEDALVDFITTGEADFKGLIDSMIRDLVRLAIRQALVNALGAAFGGLGGAAGAAAGGGGAAAGGAFANGGNPPVGRVSLVGEEGPELIVPRRPTTVIPNSMLGGSSEPAPPPQVTVVNVENPEDFTQSLNTSESENVIMNMISRNKDTVKQALAS